MKLQRKFIELQLVFNYFIAAAPGRGTSLDWNFCSEGRRCTYKQGNCYFDYQCADDHFCGENNCKDFWSDAEDYSDCCVPG